MQAKQAAERRAKKKRGPCKRSRRPRRERKDDEGRASEAGSHGLALSNSCAAFRSLAAQVLGQIFGVKADGRGGGRGPGGWGGGKYSVQFYWDVVIQCTVLQGHRNTVLQFFRVIKTGEKNHVLKIPYY